MNWIARISYRSVDDEVDEVDIPVRGRNKREAQGEVEKLTEKGFWVGTLFVTPQMMVSAHIVHKDDRLR